MSHLLQGTVFMLMVSVGMSLSPRQLLENWQLLTKSLWIRLLLATFLIPPLLALALGQLLPLGGAATAGLFLIGVAPGAPLMTRGVAKKGLLPDIKFSNGVPTPSIYASGPQMRMAPPRSSSKQTVAPSTRLTPMASSWSCASPDSMARAIG